MESNYNELNQRLLGTDGLNIAPGTVAASRKQMLANHIGQALTITGAKERTILTGMEQEVGKYTFSIKMPENGRILAVIDRYPQTYGEGSFGLNPERLIIYESDQGIIETIKINNFRSNHPYFGFPYNPQPGSALLSPGNYIPKGTVLYNSPNVDKNGNYAYGTELNMAYATHPGTSDDGVVVSRDVLPRLSTKTYERRIVEWGKEYYPINIYGDRENYKIFPDIGDYVQPFDEHKGLLMCLRKYDPAMLMIDQSREALMTIDNVFDKCTYVDGEGGRVVDILIIHQPPTKGESICDEMMEQAIKYKNANIAYRKKVVDIYFRLKKERNGILNISPEFQRFLVESFAIINYPVNNATENLRYIHKTNNVNEWRAEFVIEYTKTPTIGFKLTDTSGGKGVICKILEPEQMPIASNGLRADLIMDPASNVNRMKFSSLYEQYINVTKYDLRREFMAALDLTEDQIKWKPMLVNESLNKLDKNKLDEMINRLLRYHEIISPTQYKWLKDKTYVDQIKYLGGCIKDNIYDYFPVDNQVYLPEMVATLNKEFKSTYGPVTFIDEQGNKVVTKHPVRIGPIYIILLEKIGAEWASVSISKTQQNGIITYISGKDKNAYPIKQQAVRVLGEAETRGISSYVGADMAAELHDRSNNTVVRKQIAENILSADKPTNIDKIIDRKKFPIGYSQPLQIFNHIINCCGYRMEYSKYDPSIQMKKQEN